MTRIAFMSATVFSAFVVLTGCNTQTTTKAEPTKVAAASTNEKADTCPSPLPDDVTIVAPGDDVPVAMRALSGVWTNGNWSGARCGALAIEKIQSDGVANIIYSWGDGGGVEAGHRRITANVDPKGVLTLTLPGSNSQATYAIAQDGKLVGKFYRNGVWTIKLTKVDG